MPLRLVLLVAGTTLPLILFAAGVIYTDYVQDRQTAFQRVLETVRGIRLVLDREVQAITSGLSVLALSQALQRDDLESFRREAQAFGTPFPGSVLSLADASGRQLLNTQEPERESLPQRANMQNVRAVFETGRPAYSAAFKGAVSGNTVVAVAVPVFRDGNVSYSLAATLPLRNLQSVIESQRPNDRWTVAIFDQVGVNFARVPNPEETIGRAASPTLLAALFNNDEATLITTSLEGIELITAYTRSPLSGWTVAAGMPTAIITGPLWRSLAITAAIGVVLLGIGLFFAVQMASRIAKGDALHNLLIDELNHRVKNTLATVQSVAHQTFRGVAPPSVIAKYDGRLSALGRAHNVLSEERWSGADVRDVVAQAVGPFSQPDRVKLAGPEIRLAPRCALMISMALHELATNAAKYGALSGSDGTITIQWKCTEPDPRRLLLVWRESGGPPVTAPAHRGFGARLIEQSFVAQLGGRARLDFTSAGVIAELECPIS
jgi:two-component sensor histidine kinase